MARAQAPVDVNAPAPPLAATAKSTATTATTTAPAMRPVSSSMRGMLCCASVLCATVLLRSLPPAAADAPQLRDPAHGQAFRQSLLDAWTLTHADERIEHEDQELERFLFGDALPSYARERDPRPPRPAAFKHPSPSPPPPPPPPPYEDAQPDTQTKPHLSASRPSRRLLPLWQLARTAVVVGSDTSRYVLSLCARLAVSFWTTAAVPLVKWCLYLARSTAYAAFVLTRAVVLEVLRPVRVLVAAPIIYLFLGFYLVFVRTPYRLLCTIAREGYPVYLFLAAGGMAGLALGIGSAITLLTGTALINSGAQETAPVVDKPAPEPLSSVGSPPSPPPLPHAVSEAARLASTVKHLSHSPRPTHEPQISESSLLDESDSLRTSEQPASSESGDSEVDLIRVPMGDGNVHLRRAASYTQMRSSGWDDVVRHAEKALRSPQSYTRLVAHAAPRPSMSRHLAPPPPHLGQTATASSTDTPSLRRGSLPRPQSPAHARLHEWRLDTARAHAQAYT